jgi:hypothetical protein
MPSSDTITRFTVTNYTPFEIVKGHINSDDPFEMTDTKIISNYIQQHKEKVQTLYADIKEKTQTKKEQIIDKLNATREEPKTFIPGHSAYISTKERNKAKPKFISSKILANNDKKLKTRQGTVMNAVFIHFILLPSRKLFTLNSTNSNLS